MTTTNKGNLFDRSLEIQFALERELNALDTPCSITDMVKRTGACRMSVERHLRTFLSKPEFADISIVRVGGVDVIYRIASHIPKAEPKVQLEGNKGVESNGATTNRQPAEGNRADSPIVG